MLIMIYFFQQIQNIFLNIYNNNFGQMSLLKKQLSHFQIEWSQFCKKYHLDSQYVCLIQSNYIPQSFNFSPVEIILSNLSQLNASGQIKNVVNNLPQIIINSQKVNFKQMLILHDSLAMILQSYVVELLKTTHMQDIKIPKNLSQPVYLASQYLKCSPGILVFPYNWKVEQQILKQKNQDLTLNDIDLKWYMTQDKENQKIFWGLNFLGHYYITKIFKQLYIANYLSIKAPWFSQQIEKKLIKSSELWEKLIEQNTKMFSMDQTFFVNKLRPYVVGFRDVFFQSVQKRLSAFRGNAALDPTYQFVDRVLGINYRQLNLGFQNLRLAMNTAIPKIRSQAVQDLVNISNLRKYCEQSRQLSQAYNKIIQAQIKFSKLHTQFIMKYIAKDAPGIQKSQPLKYVLQKDQSLQKILIVYKQQVFSSQQK